MADKITNPNDKPTDAYAIYIEGLMKNCIAQRLSHERRWYDNNFFDDGYHFRYVSRSTGKIIDRPDSGNKGAPMRAIPKASRQIRGVANLLLAPEYRPVVYPPELNKDSYPNAQVYELFKKKADEDAKKIGVWLEDKWDELNLKTDLISMVLLASKNSVSYLKICPNYSSGKIEAYVRDAFDLYLLGSYQKLEDLPYIIEASPVPIDEIMTNKKFNEEAKKGLMPDNKYASSEVKQAYLRSKYGSNLGGGETPTVIQHESWVKEYITEDNKSTVNSFLDKPKKEGDIVMRHAFTAGGQTFLDEYVDTEEFPYVDLRLEPGYIYQTPFIERFIPANKSLDVAMSRVENYLNTMVVGTWIQRADEDFEISNIPGGQIVRYRGTKPEQGQIAPLPGFVFNYIELLNGVIEEQGASTAALGQVPAGVKSGVAIESLKSTEYANLKIASDQLKDTVKRIAEKMIDIASDFVDVEKVATRSNGDMMNFSVLGQRGAEARMNTDTPVGMDTVVIPKDAKLDIEVENGMGFTMEGKKETMQQVIAFITDMAKQGYLTQEQVKVVIQKFLETYQFGATQEFMDAIDDGTQSSPLTEDQINQMKVAVAQVLKDAGLAGKDAQEQQVQTTKIGVVEALKDTGMLDKAKEQPQPKSPSESISFKDLPPEGQAQMAQQAGINITPQHIVSHQMAQQEAQNVQ